jgi:RING-type zinc-finger
MEVNAGSHNSLSIDERVQLFRDDNGLSYGTNNRIQQQISQDEDETRNMGGIAEQVNHRDILIEQLTGRLRCLFSAITWPIVPVGALVILCLIWVVYSAFVQDILASCSQPLHAYAFLSVCFLLYAPYHSQVRTFLFRYSRERDGPIRPTRVRLYDQLFHTLCILYVYGGVTLMQTCKQDIGNQIINSVSSQKSMNSCNLTCPHLSMALEFYVIMLEIFTLSLVLPLLFLPCVYLWILRRASTEGVPFWQDDDSDENHNEQSPITPQELINSLEPVKFVKRGDQVKLLNSSNLILLESSQFVKECCICMCEFKLEDDELVSIPQILDPDAIIRTKCGHIFHAKCLGGWIGGRWDQRDAPRRRTRRTCCPLCREDLKPSENSRTSSSLLDNHLQNLDQLSDLESPAEPS